MDAAVFAGVDWGTTSFRLWLFDRSGDAFAGHNAPWGMTALRPDEFAGRLEDALEATGAPADLPTVVCGMAGAAEGWHPAPYSELPAPLAKLHEHSVKVPGQGRDVRPIGGLAQRDRNCPNVMRGEETTLFGALRLRPLSGYACLPGTHSKWVRIEQDRVLEFYTCLTGELFALLGRSSTLASQLDFERRSHADSPHFLNSVRQALTSPESVVHRLFSIRAAGLLDRELAAGQLVDQLSGWLIGMEVAAMRAQAGPAVTLVADGDMAASYQRALRLADFECTFISAETSVQAGLFAVGRQLWLQ